MTIERKRDEGRNHALGGIVVKAGLGDADRAFLLGALLEIAEIEIDSPAHIRLRRRGAEAFGAALPDSAFSVDRPNG